MSYWQWKTEHLQHECEVTPLCLTVCLTLSGPLSVSSAARPTSFMHSISSWRQSPTYNNLIFLYACLLMCHIKKKNYKQKHGCAPTYIQIHSNLCSGRPFLVCNYLTLGRWHLLACFRARPHKYTGNKPICIQPKVHTHIHTLAHTHIYAHINSAPAISRQLQCLRCKEDNEGQTDRWRRPVKIKQLDLIIIGWG